MDRIDTLKEFLRDDPNDSFSRYALAMEYAKLERLEDAVSEFQKVIENDSKYVATYYQLGKVYERLARFDEARDTYRRGVKTAHEAGDTHTEEELTAALEDLDGGAD